MGLSREMIAHCVECGRFWPLREGVGGQCRYCGSDELEEIRKPSEAEVSEAYFEDWVAEVREKKLWGPSPAAAREILNCSRAAVDHLVNGGALERTEYERDGHKVVVISWHSIQRVLQNKSETGNYTGRPPGRPALA